MRISDWSSDVCSSDLALADLLSDTPERQQALADEQGDEVAGSFDDLIRARAAEGWARPPSARKGMTVVLQIGMLPDGTVTSVSVSKSSGDGPFDASAVAAVKKLGRLTEKIGRASCRGRVCQYVESSVVAVLVKKKKKK